QQVKKTDKKLKEMNAALKRFQNGKYKEEKLNELREKKVNRTIYIKEKSWLDDLKKKEQKLKDAVKTCKKVWARRDKDLWQARTQTDNAAVARVNLTSFSCRIVISPEKRELENRREIGNKTLRPSKMLKTKEDIMKVVKFILLSSSATRLQNLSKSLESLLKTTTIRTLKYQEIYQQIFNEFLIDVFDLNFISITVDDGSSNNGVLLENDRYLVALYEVKNEIGEGRSDPFLQASFSVLNFWKQNKLCIAASIFTDHLIVDPLTDFVSLVPTKHPNELDYIARLFQAWKLAITDLKHFYHTNKTVEFAWSSKHPCDYQNLFPYPNLLIIDNKKVEFTYESWMSSSKSMYTATISDMNIDKIVKFTKNYCGDAHRLCASKGLAPQLFCVDRKIVSGWIMIIMENIKEAKPLHEITFNLKKDQDQMFQDIQQAISLLHHNNLVFADLHPNKILVYEKD
ncbi:12673_t:CDS:2, partial [Funneliformis caledonium]